MYIFTVCFDGGEMWSSAPVDKEQAENLMSLAEMADNIAWCGYKPYKG